MSIVEDLLPPNYFINLRIEQQVFTILFSKKLPDLYNHFQKLNINIGAICGQWFGGLYLNSLPKESVFRVWDIFFNEGSKVLYRIGLAILKQMEKVVLSMHDSTQIYVVLKEFPAKNQDINELLEVTKKKKGKEIFFF